MILNSITEQFKLDFKWMLKESEHLEYFRILMDVVIIVSVSIMPLINISTIAHFINDVETEELSGWYPNDKAMSQLILLLSKHLSADMNCVSLSIIWILIEFWLSQTSGVVILTGCTSFLFSIVC